jgi:hypothetical protein
LDDEGGGGGVSDEEGGGSSAIVWKKRLWMKERVLSIIVANRMKWMNVDYAIQWVYI